MSITMKTLKLLLISAGLLAIGGCNNDNSSNPVDSRVSIILTAFGDASSGETQPFLNVLENRVDRTSASAFCKGIYEGELSGQSVVIVTTGTGSDNSGPCTQELLNQYGASIKEIIWSGIGGATPAVGGLVNSVGQMRNPVEPVMIGDVCISALSWNYDLHFSSVTDWATASRAAGHRYNPAGGWWPMKDSDGKMTVIGFDNVQLFTIAHKALADELLAAARQVLWPPLDPAVLPKVERFFSAEQIRPTRVFDFTQCGEVSSNDFWHGVVEDRLARQYLASLIAASGYAPATTSEDEIVVFSAMESATWMSIVARWNQHYGVNIPMAVIRAASNYDHLPLDAKGDPKPGPDGKPLTAMDDILLGFEEAGASFAANNAARSVLKLFELRRLPQ
jgi:purine nucleoside permease